MTHKRLLLRLAPNVREELERLGLSWRKAFPLYKLPGPKQEKALSMLLERMKRKERLARSDVEAVVRRLSVSRTPEMRRAPHPSHEIRSSQELAAWLGVLLLLGYSVNGRALRQLGFRAEPKAVKRALRALEMEGFARKVERRYELSPRAKQEASRLATPDAVARLLLELVGSRRLPLVLSAIRFWAEAEAAAVP